MNKSCSVIVPIFNEEKTLKEVLERFGYAGDDNHGRVIHIVGEFDGRARCEEDGVGNGSLPLGIEGIGQGVKILGGVVGGVGALY